MAVENLFESESNKLGQEPYIPLGGELFDFGGEFFDFEAACNNGAPVPEQIFEDISTTFFEDAFVNDKDLDKPFDSKKSSDNSVEFDETFGGLAGDNTFGCFGSEDVFAGLGGNDPFDLSQEFDFGQVSNDTFLWPSKETAVAEPATSTQPVTNTRPAKSKQPNVLAKAAKVTKTPRKPKKAATPKKRLSASTPRERSMEELFNCPWVELTHKEREQLLLPWVKGVDPITGANIPPEESSFAASIFRSFGLDFKSRSVKTPSPTINTPARSFSSPYEALTTGIKTLTDSQVVENLILLALSEGYDLRGNKITNTPVLSSGSKGLNGSNINMTNKNVGIKTANTSATGANNTAAVQGFGSTNVTTSPGQGYAYPNSNGNLMSQPIKMPAPPAIYGSTRQKEALLRNALLRAQGRRR